MRFKNTTQQVNVNTGEVTVTHKTYAIPMKTERFVMLFPDYLYILQEVSTLSELKVFNALLQLMEYNTNKVKITPIERKLLCSMLGFKAQTFSNSLRALRKLNIIYGKSGDYQVNPHIAWKGTLDKRDSLIHDVAMYRLQQKRRLVVYSIAEVENNWQFIIANWDGLIIDCDKEIWDYITSKKEERDNNA